MLVDHRLLVCLLAIGCLHRVIMCLLVIERVCLLCACVCVCVGGWVVVRWLPSRALCRYTSDWTSAVSTGVCIA